MSGDLCICKCTPPPRLIENQTYARQQFDGDWLAGQAGAAGAAAAKLNETGINEAGSSAATGSDGVALVLLDPDTDEPYRHRPYRLQLQDSVIEGTTDRNGATRPLTAQEQASFVQWRVDKDTAPA